MKFEEKIYNTYNLSIKDIDEKTTRARAIIVNSNKEVLMCYSDGRNHYEFPGGHLEFGENLIEGLKRELLEETGIEIEKENTIPFYSIKYYCKNYHDTGKNRLVEIYYFLVYTDLVYDVSKIKLDENEKYENYECRYIGIEKIKNILFENKQTTRETNSSLDDTILVYEEFLSRNNYRR